jgi:hypothetical protein
MNELQKRNLVAMLHTKRRIAEKNEGELVAWFEGLGGQDRDDDLDTQFRLGYNSAVQELADEILAEIAPIPAEPGLASAVERLAVELVKAENELAEAKKLEEDNGYDDALDSMARTEAEGRVSGLLWALELLNGMR